MNRCFALLLLPLAFGQVFFEQVSSNGTTAISEPAPPVWDKSPAVMIAVGVLVFAALLAPFVVPMMIARLMKFALRVDVYEEEHHHHNQITSKGNEYGTFARTVSSTIIYENKDHELFVAPSTGIDVDDLPPKKVFIFEPSHWRLVHQYMDVPIGFAVSSWLISCAVEIMNLPRVIDNFHVRRIAEYTVTFVVVLTSFFALHRFIELIIVMFRQQSWLIKSKLTGLYNEISGHAGIAAKLIGAVFIVITIIGVGLGGWEFKVLIAFMCAVLIGLVGWVLLELSDEAQEMISAWMIMYFNMFRVGEDIEIFYVDLGGYRGVVGETTQKNTEINVAGKITRVPNSIFFKSCIINHSRSVNVVAFDVFVNPSKNDSAKLAKFSEGVRKIITENAIVDTSGSNETSARYSGPISLQYLTLSVVFTAVESTSVAEAKDFVFGKILELGQSLDIKFN